MLFVLHRVDDPSKTALRKVVIEEHRQHLRKYAANIMLGGPYMDPDSGVDRGSMFILEFETVEEARRFAHDDPYAKAGIFTEIQVWPWTKKAGAFSTEKQV